METQTEPQSPDGSGGTGEWPAVPPAPTPTRPVLAAPEPPAINRPRPASVTLPGGTAAVVTAATVRQSSTLTNSAVRLAPASFRPSLRSGLGEPATTAPPAISRPWRRPPTRTASQAARATTRGWMRGAASQAARATMAGSAFASRTLRRPAARRTRADDLVWQPRFIYTTAAVILAAFTVVTLPLWIALYRRAGAADAPPTEIVSLGMMLIGGFLSAVAAWVLIVEMRSRIRMADALAQTGAHEAPGTAGRAVASGLVRPFGQVWTQVSLLAVALSLFVGATIVSLS